MILSAPGRRISLGSASELVKGTSMTHRLRASLCILFLLVPVIASAQQPRDVGIFGDAAGTNIEVSASDFVPFNFYVVGFDLDGAVKAFEFALVLPPQLTVLDLTLAGPNPGNIGTDTNVIAFHRRLRGIRSGPSRWGPTTAGFFFSGAAGENLFVCVGPSTPSSFEPAVPGYSQCDNTLTPLTPANLSGFSYPDGCMVINPAVVATERSSVGAIKARY